MIKVSDYIIKRLVEYGIKDVFMISGGGAMHLNDSVGKCKDINYICNHHEQASAIAAEGYARASEKLAAVIVTTGPGGTNTLTGVIGQWLDSVPVIYISGQVKYETSIASCPELGLRQLGDQEINIVDIVRPVTKFAAIVKDPLKIKELLDEALFLATNGRPGPVWLDIPLNIQGALINEEDFAENVTQINKNIFKQEEADLNIKEAVELLEKSQRPIFIAGHGIRISKNIDIFLKLVKKLNIPVVSTFNGADVVSTDNPWHIGRIGTIGSRAGNFALQNSDLVISVGSRNNIRQISYNWKTYARDAKKIIVDIDKAELNKPTIQADIKIHSDAGYFLNKMSEFLENKTTPNWNSWLKWCQERKEKYPTILPKNKNNKDFVDLYYFTNILTKLLDEEAILVAGNGSASIGLFQAGIIKSKQKVIMNSGCASMGYDLPAAIGACCASPKNKVICFAGDGSLQMNIQELQTVVHNKLPIKIFYLNNSGYISIKQTQDSFFEGRRVACDENCGVSFPDIKKIAMAYYISYELIENHENMEDKIQKVISSSLPVICEIKLSPDYKFEPKLSSKRLPDGKMVSKPLEDMFPFLKRDEFMNNMIIKPIQE